MHLEGEELEPALVPKGISAELDHLSVDTIVGWNVNHDHRLEFRFNQRNLHQATVNVRIDITEDFLSVEQFWLEVVAVFVPVSPWSLLSFNDKES